MWPHRPITLTQTIDPEIGVGVLLTLLLCAVWQTNVPCRTWTKCTVFYAERLLLLFTAAATAVCGWGVVRFRHRAGKVATHGGVRLLSTDIP